MSWDHGYFSATSYTSGVYRELAPAWLDFAALLKGHQPPRSHEGEPFAYLELGSGMGLGLCLLAAAYPEGRFTGIDFQPDHIVHSRRLAQQLGLSNIQFQEADFLSLAANPGPLAAAHHYVVAHGIATWITAPIQQALLQLAAAALNPGGIFYCSYNTFPGWLGASAFQHLVELTRQRQAEASAAQAFQQAAASLTSLLGSEESPSALALAQPALRRRLAQIPNQNAAYLLQEYANQGWQPLYVAELAKLLALLLHAGRLGFDRCACADFERARQVNEQLLTMMRSGRSYAHLVAPASGGGVGFSLVEALLLEGQRRNLGGQELEQHLLESLKAMGRSIKGEAAPLLAAFVERQPRLQALGVLP